MIEMPEARFPRLTVLGETHACRQSHLLDNSAYSRCLLKMLGCKAYCFSSHTVVMRPAGSLWPSFGDRAA